MQVLMGYSLAQYRKYPKRDLALVKCWCCESESIQKFSSLIDFNQKMINTIKLKLSSIYKNPTTKL